MRCSIIFLKIFLNVIVYEDYTHTHTHTHTLTHRVIVYEDDICIKLNEMSKKGF